MAISIRKLRGISTVLEADLQEHGIDNSDQLLEAARTPAGRKGQAEKMGVEAGAILELANRADLSRVRGTAGVFSDLLGHVGVDTVKEMATRNSDGRHAKLVEVNARERLAGRVPSLNMVQDWVPQAKELPKLLEY